MNPNFVWIWTGGVFGGVTIIAFVVLQKTVLWWQGRGSRGAPSGTPELPRDSGSTNRPAMSALVAIIGLVGAFVLLKDTDWILLSIFGFFAVVPHGFLERNRLEARRWKTRSAVARSMDEMQILAVSRQENSVLDAYPWLEQRLKHNTIFQEIEVRLMALIGQGLAVRGSRTDLERIAREMDSEDLIQFLRRSVINGNADNARGISLRAVEQITERIRLDAEISVARITGQTTWFWLVIFAALLAAVLVPLGVR